MYACDCLCRVSLQVRFQGYCRCQRAINAAAGGRFGNVRGCTIPSYFLNAFFLSIPPTSCPSPPFATQLQRTACALLHAAAHEPPPPLAPAQSSKPSYARDAADAAYLSLLQSKAAEMSAYLLIVSYRYFML